MKANLMVGDMIHSWNCAMLYFNLVSSHSYEYLFIFIIMLIKKECYLPKFVTTTTTITTTTNSTNTTSITTTTTTVSNTTNTTTTTAESNTITKSLLLDKNYSASAS